MIVIVMIFSELSVITAGTMCVSGRRFESGGGGLIDDQPTIHAISIPKL